ncbi:MAG: aldo/keto reductase [Deltaproteobacteria bacterium]|nr:aldo/keto reductase [Deltaproteobacteria bacterium]
MRTRELGRLGSVSSLTLGGAGLGGVWGATSREEAVATMRAAVDAGITWIDVAPSYGRGEAESVLGAAFHGRLPQGVRVSTKVQLGSPHPQVVERRILLSLERSLRTMLLGRVDALLLHSNLVPDGFRMPRAAATQERWATEWSIYVEKARPVLEALVRQGRIGAWGITAVGLPRTVLRALESGPAPAVAQCVANLLDSPGGLRQFDDEPHSREIIRTARARHVGVFGIRAVQAGALTEAFDRTLGDADPDMRDYVRAAPFRTLASELGEKPAVLAHRYALSMEGVDSVIVGVKNRTELAECLRAADQGPLDAQMVARIDACIGPV